jgi:superfamily II DNA or RNA helicase
MSIELYDYQKDYIQAIRQSMKQGNKRIVFCSPTGSGKTICFTYMVKEHLAKDGKALIFTHREELLNQASNTFARFGLCPEFIKAGEVCNESAQLHVAMVETFNRRRDKYQELLESKSLVIIDEAHLQHFNKVLPLIPPETYVIGATATPERKPKGVQLCDFYTDLIQIMDTPDVIGLGKLVPAKTYGVEIDLKGAKRTANDYDTSDFYEKNKTYEGVVKNWERISKNEKTILFASNISSSKDVCNEFTSKGYNAKHIDGKMSAKARKEVMDWFSSTPNAILCNCGILTAGFDEPSIKTVILYRATTSLPLFLQMCGRGSRLYDGKTHFNILDFGNNVSRLGFWEQPREWKLDNSKKSNKEQAMPVKICPKCDAINTASARKCVVCLWEFPKPEPTKEEVVLQELKQITITKKRMSELSVKELITLQDSGKYKASFVWRVLRTRNNGELRQYAEMKGYKSGWLRRQENEPKGFSDFLVK